MRMAKPLISPPLDLTWRSILMRRLVTIVLGLMVMLLATPAVVTAEITTPVLEPGDKWTYEVIMEEAEMEFSGDWTYEVKGEKTVAGHEVYDLALDGEGTVSMDIPSFGTATMDFTVDGYRYLRISDLASVEENMTLEMSAEILGIEMSIQMYLEVSYAPPLNDFGFPLDVDKEWTSTSSLTSTSTFVMTMGTETTSETNTATSTESPDFKCESKASITVPAGTFESYRINSSEDLEEYEIDYISEKSGLFVKSEVYDDDGQLGMIMQLKSYSYSPGKDALDIMDYWWFIIIIVIVVATLAGVAAVRSRRKKEEYPPPPEYGL
jgi:hypothetical protein